MEGRYDLVGGRLDHGHFKQADSGGADVDDFEFWHGACVHSHSLESWVYAHGALSLASFQEQDFTTLQFPAQMFIDYVRIYQREDVAGGDSISCDPPSHPTAEYIAKYVHCLLPP